jgi:malonate-semialdehyde dehydrogenase (acetylating)/methylmalonate-semialdehyde dehydrogenase
MKYPRVQNFINGRFVPSENPENIDLISPVNGEKLSEVPISTIVDLNETVQVAKNAFLSWSDTPIKERVQVFFNYRHLLEANLPELSEQIQEENGKTLAEARAEIEKCIELTEFACALPQMVTGEILEVSKGVECRTQYSPIGVVASVVPFNFPAMVPHWTIPNALVLGNTMILKPSEKVPLTLGRMAKLLKKAGLPDGVFNLLHGNQQTVEAICDHPDIEAISFVGSTPVAKAIYRRVTHHYKRCLALGGAKNHLMVFPDAVPAMTAQNIAISMSGCAGQRCMAASAMIAIGPVDHIIKQLCEEAAKIIPGKNLGPVISKESKERIVRYITEAELQGAKVLLDGRNTIVEGKEGGNYVGPTIIDEVRPDMAIAREEIFGPVISIIHAKNMEEAISIENSNSYGNATSVFTQNGGLAKEVMDRACAGMIGVNIGVPVPREPFSFGGWNESKFGVGDITGRSSIEFWTKLKKSTVKWNPESGINWMS